MAADARTARSKRSERQRGAPRLRRSAVGGRRGSRRRLRTTARPPSRTRATEGSPRGWGFGGVHRTSNDIVSSGWGRGGVRPITGCDVPSARSFRKRTSQYRRARRNGGPGGIRTPLARSPRFARRCVLPASNPSLFGTLAARDRARREVYGPGGIRTPDRPVKSRTLSLTELPARKS